MTSKVNGITLTRLPCVWVACDGVHCGKERCSLPCCDIQVTELALNKIFKRPGCVVLFLGLGLLCPSGELAKRPYENAKHTVLDLALLMDHAPSLVRSRNGFHMTKPPHLVWNPGSDHHLTGRTNRGFHTTKPQHLDFFLQKTFGLV